MSLDTFYLKQLADQDSALDQRKGSSGGSSASVLKQSEQTNQVLLKASDGSTVPATDNSSSKTVLGKPVAFAASSGGAAAQVNTKIGRA